VVDDTEAQRYIIVRSLKQAGMEVLEAASGQEALALVTSQPDVVLLDVRLPDMSGFEVCRRIKADPTTTAIPVLYLSALLRDTELEERLFEDGAAGYVPQPLEPKHMVAQTWTLVRMRRGEQNRRREQEAAQAEQRRLQRELDRARAWAEQLTEAGLVAIFSWHQDGAILQANDAFLAMVGATREDLKQGRLDWKRMTPPGWEEQDRQRLALLKSGGKLHLREKQFLRMDGSRVEVMLGSVSDGDNPQRGLTMVLDITERKLTEQRAAALQATTSAISQALTPKQVADAVVTHGLQVVGAHAGAVSLVQGEALVVLSTLGYPESLVQPYRASPLSLRTPPTDAARTGEAVWVETREDFDRGWPEVARRMTDTQSRSWAAIPLRVGTQVVGVLGLSFSTPRPISGPEKAYLEALCQLCAQALERAHRFEEEHQAREAAQKREELEQQFLGVVSHDLRNPLSAIVLGAQTLQRMERPAPEVLARTARRIASSADTMGRMISDLLDFTRGRLGGGIPLERAANDLVWLCQEVIDEFLVTHPDSDIRLAGDAVCEGWVDGARIRQMLSNLLSNALRHARPETPVGVRVLGSADEVVLSISNQGPPIPAELLPVLFEPFRRGVAQFRPSGSLGLGLYIVRLVATAHRGRVEVDTGEAGTTFTARLPRGVSP
jgi:PAS domain S-box-containing protein